MAILEDIEQGISMVVAKNAGRAVVAVVFVGYLRCALSVAPVQSVPSTYSVAKGWIYSTPRTHYLLSD